MRRPGATGDYEAGGATGSVTDPERDERPARARRGGASRTRRLKLFGLGVLALLLGVTPVVAWNSYRAHRLQEEQEQRELSGRTEALFQQGQELLRSQRYGEARAKFVELREQDPGYPVKDFITRAEREAALQNVLVTAKEALAKDRLGEAMNWLSRVPDETEQLAELRRLREAVETRARARVRDARAALDRDRLEDAIRICDDVLKVLPDSRDAAIVRADALARHRGR
jgi:outer membrane protein assembly factor BamD (BamD/ComL family)